MSATLLTTQDAFLADIRERPDDDAPRLIFADWLDDEGRAERAEWIRYDVRYPHAGFSELTRRDPFPLLGLAPTASVHVGPTVSFAAGLSHDDWRTWMWGETDELGCVVSDLGRGLDYHTDRGMIDAVMGKFSALDDHLPALAAAHALTGVRVTDRKAQQWLRANVGNLPAEMEGRWFWCVDAAAAPNAPVHWAPRTLYRSPVWYRGEWFSGAPHYATEDAANDALSDAYLLWARSQNEKT